jgi:hypothetical protein
MTSELLAPGWHPDPTGQPGQKYWDGQTSQAIGPPTIPADRKPKTWIKRIKRIAKDAAVMLFALAGSEWGIWIQPFGTDPEDWTDPEVGTDPEDGHV